MRFAAIVATRVPTFIEPVKLTSRTCGWLIRISPAVTPEPSSTLNTPAGSPAAIAVSASSVATYDAISLGLSTTVLPNASAGAAFQSGMATGKFHGVMSAAMPSGSCSANCIAPAACEGITAPLGRTASPA